MRTILLVTFVVAVWSSTPTNYPTFTPSRNPTQIILASPSPVPTVVPLSPTQQPSTSPSSLLTKSPTFPPSQIPTSNPSVSPTMIPSQVPSKLTGFPTPPPSMSPTAVPSSQPSNAPSRLPSSAPTLSKQPSQVPTRTPSISPTFNPTLSKPPSQIPTRMPSVNPTVIPTLSKQPSQIPTRFPSFSPSLAPTASKQPSPSPSQFPSVAPTLAPTLSKQPSQIPTRIPSYSPTLAPTLSKQPSQIPTRIPSYAPSLAPTLSKQPSLVPTKSPSVLPVTPSSSVFPTSSPTRLPTYIPSPSTTNRPTKSPTSSPSSPVPTANPDTLSYPSKLSQAQQTFAKYQSKYKLTFDSQEALLQAQQAFTKNLAKIHALNNDQSTGTATFSINKFSHIPSNQFSNTKKGFVPVSAAVKALTAKFVDKRPEHLMNVEVSTTKNVNWAGIYTSAIKDQQQCGSCWIFSAVEQIESDAMRLFNKPTTFLLSEQEVLDCIGGSSCDGGDPSQVYTFATTYGLVSESRDPYKGSQVGCTAAEKSPAVIGFSSSYYFNNPTEQDLAVYIQNTGPLSICIATGGWDSYAGGVLTAGTCGTSVDHCVQLVGLQMTSTDPSTPAPYWVVRVPHSAASRTFTTLTTCPIFNIFLVM